MKLSQILESGTGDGPVSSMSDEDLARALRTDVKNVRGEGRAAAEEYYMDKAQEYAMDMAGEMDRGDEEEESSVEQSLEKISIDIVELAEGLVADQAADEGGRGFSGDALARKTKEIMTTLQSHVDKTVQSYATWR